MKKTTIHISYDEDKLSALVMYLAQKNMSVEAELQASLNALYQRHVPSSVREFVAMRGDGNPEPIASKRKPKESHPHPAEVTTDGQ